MKYLSVSEIAKKWGLSERTIRNYCNKGKINGAFMIGKTWNIPEDSLNPVKKHNKIKHYLLDIFLNEKNNFVKGGIYHKTQVNLAYNSNHIEGSRLSEDQTRYIYETNTIGIEKEPVNINDIFETINHFKCFDFILENALLPLTQDLIKKIHFLLKYGTKDTEKGFNVGEYKKFANEVGGEETCKPENVKDEMQNLLENYNSKENKTIEDIVEFHKNFESIHPFQDGNGRVGRLILFKECLANNIVPFIITERLKFFYYRGLKEWNKDKVYLMDTCLSAQDQFKEYLKYFNIIY